MARAASSAALGRVGGRCLAVALVGLSAACSAGRNVSAGDTPGDAGGGAPPATAGTAAIGNPHPQPGGAGGTSGSAQTSVTCDQCGASRAEACEAEYRSCVQDEACSRVQDCVYATPACPLDSAGPACVAGCIELERAGPETIERFLVAESCAFCEETCSRVCGAYCSPLSQFEAPAAAGAAGAAAGH